MPDRLSELARQRALVSEHLAWLDREIAEETVKRLASGEAAPSSPSLTPAAPVVVQPPPPPVSIPSTASVEPAAAGTPASAIEPDQLIEQYRVEPSTVKSDVRKGCLLYFVGAFAVLGIVIAILYFTIGSH